jgi:membrane-bound serine protease (ClpP class)
MFHWLLAVGWLAGLDAGVAPSAPEALADATPDIVAPPVVGALREAAGALVILELKGGITEAAREYVSEHLAAAHVDGAQALIITLDTPGGLLQATRSMVAEFLNSDVPVIVWVGPPGARAGSAGVFITLAAHVAAMAPGTNIGAAHPVSAFGGDIEGEMKKKIANDTVAWARSIAAERGRNADWAAQAVSESASITADRAVALRVVDFKARTLDQLIAALDGRVVQLPEHRVTLRTEGAERKVVTLSTRQALVQFLADPNLAYILMLIGMFGIFIEFKSPGLVIPGLIGALCLAVVFGVQTMPINWFGALLMVAAAVCLIAEIYVPSFGLLSVIGIGCLLAGSFLLFDVPGSDFRVDSGVIFGAAGGFVAVILVIGAALAATLRAPTSTGKEVLIGSVVEVAEAIGPQAPGRVTIGANTYPALCEVAINAGEQARVLKIIGIKAVVEPVTPKVEYNT